MKYSEESLVQDIKNIQQISVVPTILEVVCRSTGMGFAAIGRVTEERWIACGVRDEILFGLEVGGELEIKTTICDEIRQVRKPVIIDDVSKSEIYCAHHTPLLYGFQSYISVPIILKNGEFFGTLCALDLKPALINDSKTIGMFNLFTELIAFHLQSIQLVERSEIAVKQLSRQLLDSKDENRQYQHISNHNLQEPLRKIRIFSNMLMDSTLNNKAEKVKEIAFKINSSAQRFSMMIKDLSDFSELNIQSGFQDIDLNQVIVDVKKQLGAEITTKKAVVEVGLLPTIYAVPSQIEQLFYHLINNALRFSQTNVIPHIQISSVEPDVEHVNHLHAQNQLKLVGIHLQDNGLGIEKSQLENIFDIFSRLPHDRILEGEGIGLAYCRKIIRNHGGSITAHSESGKGTSFSITLPVQRKS